MQKLALLRGKQVWLCTLQQVISELGGQPGEGSSNWSHPDVRGKPRPALLCLQWQGPISQMLPASGKKVPLGIWGQDPELVS